MDNNQPIIVKRVKKSAAGHHGGAWKIAFADFATAMMAFFLVLWLMSSATPEQKKAISGYFQDPIGFTESASPYVIDLGGTPTPAPDRTLNPELKDAPDAQEQSVDSSSNEQIQTRQVDPTQAENLAEQVERERLEMLLQELQNKVEENPELRKFKDQILFEITQDGLRIQIMDAANRPMFDLGSARLQPYFEDILLILARPSRPCRTRSASAATPTPNRSPAMASSATGSCPPTVPTRRGAPWLRAVTRMSRWRAWWVMPRRPCSTARTRSTR